MIQKNIKYLDYNATTPLHPEVLEVMKPYFYQNFGNPASNHLYGWAAEESVESARNNISKLLGAKNSEISFFSSATEAINTALIGFASTFKNHSKHILTCSTEHNAVLKTCEYLETEGFSVTYLKVNNLGQIDDEELLNSIQDNTILICLMLANNETGVLHPIKDLVKKANNPNLVWITDATSAFGKTPISLKELGIDMAIFSGHKIYGPKGIAILYKKANINLKPIIHGGMNESGLKAGTLNVPSIIGLEKAIQINNHNLMEEITRIEKLRNRIENELLLLGDINGSRNQRISNTSNFQFKNIDNSNLLRRLYRLAISQGSACSANTTKPSHVLKSMGLSENEALSSIRISLGRYTTSEDVDFTIDFLKTTISKLKI